jgi:hypothetical protein
MSQRERWQITVEALPGRELAISARLLLKRLLRAYGLRCVDIHSSTPDAGKGIERESQGIDHRRGRKVGLGLHARNAQRTNASTERAVVASTGKGDQADASERVNAPAQPEAGRTQQDASHAEVTL